MSIRAYIYRSELGDSTNGGVTAEGKVAILIGPEEEIPEVAYPVLRVVEGNVPGAVKAVPVAPRSDGRTVGPMMGGNYVGSSGTAIRELIKECGGTGEPMIPVHDRYETPAEYELLSR